MWIVFIVLNLGAVYCAVSSSFPSPINVIFSSVNLRNIVQWLPGNGTPTDAHFSVQYAIYGDSIVVSKGRRLHWRPVQQCTEIARNWCDLSNETGDLEQGYNARVRAVSRTASSKWALTLRRFDPISDTSFGPPLVSVEMEDNSAVITLKGPMRNQPNNDTPAISMVELYPQMLYNISIRNNHRGHTNHFQVASSPYKHRLMDYDTDYCFSAKTTLLSIPIQCHSSEWQCITTPPDPVIGQLKRVVVGIVAPSVCMCMLVVVGYLLYQYLTGKGQKIPYILNPPSFYPPPLAFPPENISIIPFSVIKLLDTKGDTSDPACPKTCQPDTDPPPSYAPQRSESPWDDLSIDYGFVGGAPKVNVRGEEEERKKRHDRGEDGNNLNLQDGHSAGVYAPKAKSNLCQKLTHTCSQTHTPIHTQTCAQTEISTLVKAQAFSQVNSVPLNQTQATLPSFWRTTRGDVDSEKEDRKFPGLYINKTPQTALFHVPLNLETKKEGEMGEEINVKVEVRTGEKKDGGVEEGRNSEEVPLLSAYASQNITHMPTFHAGQSDFLPDDYGVLGLAKAPRIHADYDDDDDEEEEGTICIKWDPKTRKLELPEMVMKFNEEGCLDELMQGEEGRGNRVGGEEEEYVTKGELRLENVIFRQLSEEEAEVQRELERGGEMSWEADDILTKWNLVIAMDQ